MGRNRTLTLFIVLVLMVLAGTGSWIAGSSIQSPEEAAARTAPPTPSPILVPVEERVLSADVVTRGTARYGLPRAIHLVPSALKGEVGIITSLPQRNTQVEEGDVLLTASGRPLFILKGESPAYRDIVPGASGDDVRQLERALTRLGFNPGTVDGKYDDRTADAVEKWYDTAGWQAFGATPDQLANIRALERELAVANNDKLTAEEAVSTASAAVWAATAEMNANVSAAAAVVKELQVIRDALWSDWAPDQDRAVADKNLEAAKVAETTATAVGQSAILSAQDARSAAERQVQTAIELIDQLTAELEVAQRAAGVKVPIDEIVFLPDLPVRVERLDLVVGDAASGPALIVTNNQLALDSSLPLEEAPLVQPGMPVAIDEPDLGIKATGVVSRVAANPGTDGVDGFHIYFETLVEESSTSLEGFSLRMTIPVQSTGEAAIVVPVSALSLSADGTSRVQVDRDGELTFVVVEPGLSANGFVAVTPVEGTLEPGELVVIGFEQQ
jgi:peptidoglycan hydrolase-like protein with peptidoglycan-binding domain